MPFNHMQISCSKVKLQMLIAQGGYKFVWNIVNTGKCLGRPVNMTEANKQAGIYVGMPLTLQIFCFVLFDYTCMIT